MLYFYSMQEILTEYFIRNKILISILFFVMNISLFSDDAILGADGHNVYPINTNAIAMDSERVTITFFSPDEVFVECLFYFRNKTDKKQNVFMGFPQEFYRMDNSAFEKNRALLKNFSTYENGKAIPYAIKWEDTSNITQQIERRWYTFNVVFSPGEKKKIENTYTTNSLLSSNGDYSFFYILKTGASWSGSIGDAKFIFKFPKREILYSIESITPGNNNISVKENKIILEFHNFEPDSNIDIEFIPVSLNTDIYYVRNNIKDYIIKSAGNYPIQISESRYNEDWQGDFYPTWSFSSESFGYYVLNPCSYYKNKAGRRKINVIGYYGKDKDVLKDFYEARDIQFPFFSGKKGKNGKYHIYRLNEFKNKQGTYYTQLTNSQYNELYPRSYEDKIVYYIEKPGSSEIWIMNTDGSGQKPIVQNFGDCRYPSISGEYVAFESKQNNNVDIWLLNLSTGKKKRLTEWKGFDGRPSVSSVAEKVAFVSGRYGNKDIFVYDIPTEKITRITYNKATDFAPFFSGRGDKLLFTSFRVDGKSRIFLLPAVAPEVH